MKLRLKYLTGRGREESSDDLLDENQSDSECLQQIGQDLSSKGQLGKPLSNALSSSIISEI